MSWIKLQKLLLPISIRVYILVDSSFEHIDKLSINDLLREWVPMIYDTLAEKVCATQHGQSTLEEFIQVPSKLGSFRSGKELIRVNGFKTITNFKCLYQIST